jgi:hypothetical protein
VGQPATVTTPATAVLAASRSLQPQSPTAPTQAQATPYQGTKCLSRKLRPGSNTTWRMRRREKAHANERKGRHRGANSTPPTTDAQLLRWFEAHRLAAPIVVKQTEAVSAVTAAPGAHCRSRCGAGIVTTSFFGSAPVSAAVELRRKRRSLPEIKHTSRTEQR